jgi:hypothetical protein
VADGLDRLRHHLVVRGHDEHHDVGNLRAPGPHGGERLVARRVEEGDLLARRQLDVIGADVLGDSPRLARHDVRFPDVVEQRSLAVVNVAHDGHDRRPGYQLLRALHGLIQLGLRRVLVFLYRLEAKGGGDQLDLVEVEALVHRHHQSQFLEGKLHDLGRRYLHGRGQLRNRDELVHPDQGLLSLALFRQAAGLHITEGRLVSAPSLATSRTLHSLQGPQDVGVHRLLIYRRPLSFLAFLPASALFGVGSEGADRGSTLAPRAAGTSRSRGSTRPGGSRWRAAAEHRLGTPARCGCRTLDSRRDEGRPGRGGRQSRRPERGGIGRSTVDRLFLGHHLAIPALGRSGW